LRGLSVTRGCRAALPPQQRQRCRRRRARRGSRRRGLAVGRIEGGEDALFNGDTSWLGQFPLVIIELHDWMLPFSGSSRNFIKSIAQYDFDFVHKGENIFLFNRQLLNT
jgi:hypothetical protein